MKTSLCCWLRALREGAEVSASFLLEIYLLIQVGAALGQAQMIRLGADPVRPGGVSLSLSLQGVMVQRSMSEPH